MIETKVKIIQNKVNSICQYFKNLVEENELVYRTGHDREKVLLELESIENTIFDKASLTIAFVGEYNAGKTTIINILTGKNFPTSTKPETAKAIEIPWNNYRIIDTPGLASGNPDHDEETKKWLEGADLLIYLLTPDLLTSFAGRRFHDILKKYNRKQELMLVMNMIDEEGNDIEIYKEELQNAIDPTPLDDYYPTFISAKYYNLSNETDDLDDKNYYIDKSRFDTFMKTFDAFLLNKEQKSRLTTPLMKLYALFQTIEINNEFNKEIELLNLKIQFLNETIKTIGTIRNDFESALDAKVLLVSGNVYSALDNPPKNFKEFLEKEFEEFNQSITGAIDYLAEQTNLILVDFENEKVKLENSDLSKEVENRIKESPRLKEIFEKVSVLTLKKDNGTNVEFFQKIKENAIEIESKGGGKDKIAETIFKGDYKQLSTKLISKIDRKLVLDIGHRLGHKFKPWEAVKLTGKISKRIAQSVPFINIAVAVWDVGYHYYNKNKEENAEQKLREFKLEVKENLNNAVLETKKVVSKEMISPLLENLTLLKILHNDKKKELLEVSNINKGIQHELELHRQLCLNVHDEVYETTEINKGKLYGSPI